MVNFHDTVYTETDFILKSYFERFRILFPYDFDVVILGPDADRRRHVIKNDLPKWGHYSYDTLAVAYNQLCVKESCSYSGFMYMNDDSYIDPQFLQLYNLSHSWSEPSTVLNVTDRWWWFRQRNVKKIRFLSAFRHAIQELKKTKVGKECDLHNNENLRRGWGDAFYITRNDMPKWLAVINVMKKHYVFLELAAPTANWCVSRQFFVNCNHGKMLDRHSCVHMHPVKYRKEGMKEFSLKRLDHLNMDDTPLRAY